MRWVEFLTAVLEAQALTLDRLAALLGQDVVLKVLERAGERAEDLPPERWDRPPPEWFEPVATGPFAPDEGEAYAELASAVAALRVPEVLEFHLWAYPHYRAWIEGAEPSLQARIDHRFGPKRDSGLQLVELALRGHALWVAELALAEPFQTQIARAAEIPWLRFRTQTLKRIGQRPMGPVY